MNICAESISMAGDIIVAIAAAVGAAVAVLGLGAWKKQLKGSSEYELTKRLLKCTYRLRDAIGLLRHPAMWGAEMPEPPAELAAKMNYEEHRFYGTSGAYTKRWSDVNQCRRDLQVELLEAEALWGNSVQSMFAPVFALQHELWMDIFNYLRSIDPKLPEASRLAHGKLRTTRREVMYDLSTETPDEFAMELSEAIKAIEKVLRVHFKA